MKPGQRRDKEIFFTNFQAGNHGTSSGDYEGNCDYNLHHHLNAYCGYETPVYTVTNVDLGLKWRP